MFVTLNDLRKFEATWIININKSLDIIRDNERVLGREIQGLQSKMDKIVNNPSIGKELKQIKDVLVIHADRVDELAKFLGVEYIHTTKTAVDKGYRKVKKSSKKAKPELPF